MPEFQIDIESEPMNNTSLVFEQNQLIFPQIDLVIDLGGVRQFSNPKNYYTPVKIVPANMIQMEPIGKGAAGFVRKAIYKYEGMEKLVAIKEIIASDKENRKQLLNDLKTFLTGQMCDNLVKFYGCYYHAGLVKQVIEYMNLGSLRNLITLVVKKKLEIEQNDLRIIIYSILKGLYHIHKVKHQIHRDIKPQNILMNDKGQIKISDFGISKYMENTMAVANTYVDIGAYMSPQRLGTNIKYSYKCDVWGLGLILYELATGLPLPYIHKKGQGKFIPMQRIINDQPPNLDNTTRSPQLKNFIHTCLQRDQDKRFSVEQLLVHPWIANKDQGSNLLQLMTNVQYLMENQ